MPKTYFEADGLMRAHNNSDSQIILSDDFGQSGVFCVVESESFEFFWNLKSKSAHFGHSFHHFVGHGADLVVVKRVVFVLEKAGKRVYHCCQVFLVFFWQNIWVGKHVLGVNSTLKMVFRG